MKLNGSEIIVECLKEQGVDTIFGYPGGAILNVYDALYTVPQDEPGAAAFHSRPELSVLRAQHRL